MKHGRCVRIHAELILYDDPYGLRYVRKAKERGRIDADAFFNLPRRRCEIWPAAGLVDTASS